MHQGLTRSDVERARSVVEYEHDAEAHAVDVGDAAVTGSALSHYKIILNLGRLQQFIDWLPDLGPGEMYYVCLFARSKYLEAGQKQGGDKEQLKRVTATKDHLLSKIRQMECVFGAYTGRGGRPIPQEALALYITPNPRSLERAAKQTLIELAKLVTEPYKGYNPHSVALSEIQKARGRQVYVDFDFDGKTPSEVLDSLEDLINHDCLTILKTRGGCHLLVETALVADEFKKRWYASVERLGPDVRGDCLLPVPGCVQGGYEPRFVMIRGVLVPSEDVNV